MKQRSLFIFCIILVLSGFAAAQTRTVTNIDLEKYRQDRLQADREYRENYARLGFPSPEELDRRRDQSFIEMKKLSEKFRDERLQREQIELQREAAEQQAAANGGYVVVGSDSGYGIGSYYNSYGYGNLYRYNYPNRYRRQYTQPGYYSGGFTILTGPATRPQPLIARPRSPRR